MQGAETVSAPNLDFTLVSQVEFLELCSQSLCYKSVPIRACFWQLYTFSIVSFNFKSVLILSQVSFKLSQVVGSKSVDFKLLESFLYLY